MKHPQEIDYLHPGVARHQLNQLYDDIEESGEVDTQEYSVSPPKVLPIPRSKRAGIDHLHPGVARLQLNRLYDDNDNDLDEVIIGAVSVLSLEVAPTSSTAPPGRIQQDVYPAGYRAIINHGTAQQVASLRMQQSGGRRHCA
ncbi:hypothetical protein BCR33DRAFT_720142 [Rhizoclosmatium globosum]|uniref:Uncharacterized protein n=1 Tax=Rhizoclosmatium globosum TaxID=329046 RepID=A0A1Y2BX38_9FUNG|nr:hypothetical protein BCR33DRAFT_720142 [Rhizoclosmatium globosum]|eukprot:ORY39308.1 hypothetical protein BCR33DRAFT_720142 [Rhizoclosmatium globosum]